MVFFMVSITIVSVGRNKAQKSQTKPDKDKKKLALFGSGIYI